MSMESLPPEQSEQPASPRCLKLIIEEIAKTKAEPQGASVEVLREDEIDRTTLVKLGCLAGNCCSAWRIALYNTVRDTWQVPRRSIGDLSLNRNCAESNVASAYPTTRKK